MTNVTRWSSRLLITFGDPFKLISMNFYLILKRFSLVILFSFLLTTTVDAQEHSVARQWNEQLLEAIRNDFARPVVHARNLYHISAGMYDAWAMINAEGSTALMATEQNGYFLPIEFWNLPDYGDKVAASEEAMSYVAYRLLLHRFVNAPGLEGITERADLLMAELGYDVNYTGVDYLGGTPADLGNYIASQIIAYGLQDGSNEAGDYANLTYPDPVNPPLQFTSAFSIFQHSRPSRWSSLQFPGTVIDQSGNVLGNAVLPFLGAEWGEVVPFSLRAEDRTENDPNLHYGNAPVYHDPGPPPVFEFNDFEQDQLDQFRWGFEVVLKWSAHLDPSDGVMWDISPGALGNFQGEYPTDFEDYPNFYREREGGTFGANGHDLNPATGAPYEPNIVPRGDYARVLAEFWADGPESETPPGHWFVIMNNTMDHPDFERKFAGEGEELTKLEYDLKAYLTLGGAMHDAAITAWSIKGAYDYVRPIGAIRNLARNGQSSDPGLPRYNQFGLKLDPGFIEELGDVSELENNPVLAQVRVKSWIGPDAIDDPETDVAGVGWINPLLWMPYQRGTFVTPNFAGYVSGHSTYSAAAASVLEELTGSPYFPGGMAEYVCEANEFLVFEEGPSVDVRLQWATYRDASDQTSLSRIWGGIHPPADDIPGRIAGIELGEEAFAHARDIFNGSLNNTSVPRQVDRVKIIPNPVAAGNDIMVEIPFTGVERELVIYDAVGREVYRFTTSSVARIPATNLQAGLYLIRSVDGAVAGKVVVQ